MDSQQLLTAAQQGHPGAIAQIMHLGLAPYGIRASVTCRQQTLLVLLESLQALDAGVYGEVIWKGVKQLNPPHLQKLYVCGQQYGHPQPDWQRCFELHPLAASPEVSSPKTSAPPLRSARQWLALLLPMIAASSLLGAATGAIVKLRPLPPVGGLAQRLAQVPVFPTPTLTPPPELLPRPELPPLPPFSPPTPITIKAVGDIILGTDFPENRLPPNQGKQLLQPIKPYLKGADFLFGNYESTFTTYRHPAKVMVPGKPIYAFRTPPGYVFRLREAGFHVLSVANNHSFDFFERGFLDTIRSIQVAGMQAVGKKKQILYTPVRSQTVAWIGFSYLDDHNSVQDLATAQTLVQQAKQKADIVVVSYHAGSEGADAVRTLNQTEYFRSENRGNVVAFSRTVVDAGADLVLGHGPHVPRAIELYRDRLIAYSLGNFVGYQTLSTVGNLGHSLILSVELDPTGEFLKGEIIPVQLNGAGVPFYDPQYRSVKLIQQLNQLDFPKTPLRIDNKGILTRIQAPQ